MTYLVLVYLLWFNSKVSFGEARSEAVFAELKEKQSVILFENLSVGVGPLALSGDVVYFSERVFDSPLCLGQDLYVSRVSKPGLAPVKLAEIPCIIDLSGTPKEGVAIRYWDGHGKVVLWEGGQVAPNPAPFQSPLASNGKLKSEFWLRLFDVRQEFIDGAVLEHFPSNLASRAVAWVTSDDKKQFAVGVYTMGGEKIVAAPAPAAAEVDRLKSVLSFGDDALYFPSEGMRLNRVPLSVGAGKPIAQWGANAPNLPPAGTIVPAPEWGVREITQLKSSVLGDAVWILGLAMHSGERSVLWYHDPDAGNFRNVPNVPGADISSIYPLRDGLLVGTLSGRVLWLRSPQGKNQAAKQQKAAECRYRSTSVQTDRGRESLVSYREGETFSPLLITQTIQPGSWLCAGENLALLSSGYRFLWAEGQTTFSVEEDSPGSSIGTNLAPVLQWQSEVKTAPLPFTVQAPLPPEPPNPTLLIFSGRSLKMARSGFGGNTFHRLSGVVGDSVTVELAPATVRYSIRVGWDGSGFQGVAK